ncbi:MAG: restriction endonuclease subunit S [Verrucomicrobiaceae bacterium]|nr:MAG: restriction endonuclease subunit S [Verrucomicrobiaceae bacterium]
MTAFHQIKLGDALTLQRGFDITKAEQTDGNVPIVSSSGISSYHNKWKVKKPGLIIGRKGTLGTVHFIRSNCWPHDTTLWVKDFKGNDPLFLSFFLQTLKLENFDVGSANPTLNRNHVHKIKVIFPKTIDTQKKIAAILSAYDELIENNRRRIALLEKLAEEIYREWFVRLRFPGHEKVRVTKGVPQGWSIQPASEAFHVMGGGTPKTEVAVYWDGEISFFTPKDSHFGFYVLDTEKTLTEKGLQSCSSQLFPAETIFITARGTVGELCLAHRPMAMNQSCYALAPRGEQSVYFHFLAMKLAITYIKGISKSGVFDNIVIDTFKNVPIRMPSAELLRSFNEMAKPIFAQIGCLLQTNVRLTETRDKLLPRLISGKLSVEDLGIQFPPGMAEELTAATAEVSRKPQK